MIVVTFNICVVIGFDVFKSKCDLVGEGFGQYHFQDVMVSHFEDLSFSEATMKGINLLHCYFRVSVLMVRICFGETCSKAK
jgi:hypothetical protein